MYESLLGVFDGYRNVRLTYTDGDLEIIAIQPPHEKYSWLLDKFVTQLSEEFLWKICPVGSSTLKRPDLEKGLEADQSYYVQHESVMRDKRKLDLLKMPPPDLVVEVDITSHSIDKLPIYAAMGIGEVWRYTEHTLTIYSRSEGGYVECEGSPTFANLPVQTVIPKLIEDSFEEGNLKVLRRFREWVKQELSVCVI